MRILIVSQYFWPEQFRINDVAEDLVNKGHEVDVLTGIPNYPHGKIFEDYEKNKNEFLNFKGAKIFRVPIWLRRNSSQINLFLNYLSFILSGIFFGYFFLRKRKYDFIFTFATSPITVSVVSIFFSKIKNAKSILWVLDLWPNILFELSIIKNKFLYHLLMKLVIKIYISNDIILAQSKTFIKIIKDQIKPHKKEIYYFPAWPEVFKNQKKLTISQYTDIEYNFSKKINIVFTGNVGEAQNFDNILKVAKELKNEKNIQWTIIGSGRKLQEIKIKIKNEKIETFFLKGHMPINEVEKYHNKADILLISLSKGEGLSGTIPGKLQTYLNSKKFILGMIGGESKKIIEDTNSGVCFAPDDIKGMSEFLRKIVDNKQLLLINNQLQIDEYLNKNFNKKKILKNLDFYFNKLTENLELKLIDNLSNIPFEKNFSLSGLNLAFIGFYNLNLIKLHKDLYLWPDGIFAKKFFNKITKLPGRLLIKNITLPQRIDKIYVLGNLSEKSKLYLESLYSRKVIHIKLPHDNVDNIFEKYCKIQFDETDLILITLPTPKQELLSEKIREYSTYFKILCVGGAVTMASGEERSIPKFFENNGLEFLWRLKDDTRRRFYRLIVSFISYLTGLIFMKYNKFKKKIM